MLRLFAAAAAVAALIAPASSVASVPVVNGERLIEFAAGTPEPRAQAVLENAGAQAVEQLPGADIYRAEFADAPAAVRRLRDEANVTDISANRIMTAAFEPRPEMALPFLHPQLHSQNDRDINILGAWDYGLGDGQLIAVIDTGLYLNHPDISGRVWVNPTEANNGTDDDGDGIVDDVQGINVINNSGDVNDSNGHGTFVAGLAAADDNAYGLIGAAPHANILPIKALTAAGQGTDFNVAKGIMLALRHNADVINLSLAVRDSGKAVRSAIAAADARGVLIVAAAGNDGINNDRLPTYPGNLSTRYSNVLSVAAVTDRDELAGFSNYGQKSVGLAAPGYELVGLARIAGLPSYKVDSGTSFAAPLVSATAALMAAQAPHLGAEGIRRVLQQSARKLPTLAGKTVSGGRLDALAALQGLHYDRKAPGKPKPLAPGKRKRGRTLLRWRPVLDDTVRTITYRIVVDNRVVKTVESKETKKPLAARVKTPRRGTWFVVAVDKAGNQTLSAVSKLR